MRVLLAALTVALSAAPAPAAPETIPPALACPALAGFRTSTGSVTTASVVTDQVGATTLSFCDVHGELRPGIRFEVKLPTANWHGDFLQIGCSSYCGQIPALSPPIPVGGLTCPAADNGELVVAADDEGHQSASQFDAAWAANNQLARLTFGVTSEHITQQMAKDLIRRYYGRPQEHSYYSGCSTGGREALMLAQRFPADFDGILSGAPAADLSGLQILQVWLVRSNSDTEGHQIVPAEKLPALHAAVLKACGNADSVVPDPLHCKFDPASLLCGLSESDTCLTAPQADAVRKFYQGPVDAAGHRLYAGGEPYGSELGWSAWMIGPAADPAAPGDTPAAHLALGGLKYLDYPVDPPADTQLGDFAFTQRNAAVLRAYAERIYNADNPDLTAFRAHGGKLILYHGLADQSIPPAATVAYYASVEHRAGGFAASQRFSRLYLIPGAYHCLFSPDGKQAAIPDFLSPLMTWVAGGPAPAAIDAEIVSLPDFSPVLDQQVRPADALR